MRKNKYFLAILIAACEMPTEGIPIEESSSSTSEDLETTITTSVSGSSTITSTSITTSDQEGSESSESTDDGSGSDSSSGSSETGEPVEPKSYALAFDGGLAISGPTNIVNFDGDPFTIEMWVRISGDLQGVLFDTTVTVPGPNGMTLVRDPAWTSTNDVVFYDFGTNPPTQLGGMDPGVVAPGWHHVAFVHSGSAIKMWVDGSLAATQIVEVVSDNASAPIAIGTQPTTPFVPLRGFEIDELRISVDARYDAPFIPQSPMGSDGASLHWTFDEGQGTSASDSVYGLELELSNEGIDWIEVE